jgi:hypothetical protein
MAVRLGQRVISPDGRRFKVQALGGCDSQSRPVAGLQRLDRRDREQKVIWRPEAEVDGWAGAVLAALEKARPNDPS